MPTAEELPAWSEPFEPSGRDALARLPALDAIDREWAWGGASGAGVSVAIIDSGVDVVTAKNLDEYLALFKKMESGG